MKKKIKFVQLNIYMGKYLNELIEFLIDEEPDFIAAQEVPSGHFSLFEDKTVDVFEQLKEKTGFDGVLDPVSRLKGDEDSMFGNAVFSKHPIKSSEALVLKSFRPITLYESHGNGLLKTGPLQERHLIDVSVKLENKLIHIISWHGAWVMSATDTEESIRQAKVVSEHLKSLKDPYILAGDLNVGPESKTVELVNNVAKNLMVGSEVKQTTHPTVHKIAPKGLLIDYVFVSHSFKLVSLGVPDILVSDHLPVVCELEIEV
jgi:endonuclease/exonuclease/phosphatase family metal-dependent hydrolase